MLWNLFGKSNLFCLPFLRRGPKQFKKKSVWLLCVKKKNCLPFMSGALSAIALRSFGAWCALSVFSLLTFEWWKNQQTAFILRFKERSYGLKCRDPLAQNPPFEMSPFSILTGTILDTLLMKISEIAVIYGYTIYLSNLNPLQVHFKKSKMCIFDCFIIYLFYLLRIYFSS